MVEKRRDEDEDEKDVREQVSVKGGIEEEYDCRGVRQRGLQMW